MNLLVDIGNARIKWALQDGDELVPGEPALRGDKAFKDIARPLWKHIDPPPQRVVVSNVAGRDYEKLVHTWVKRRWKIAPEFLNASDRQCDVVNAYREPERLGADRWAALLAAHAHYKGAAIIVDCGTAITIDALAADGRHLGGLIAPGIDLMGDALTARAPGIDIVDREKQDVALLGSSTEAGIAGGVLYTAVALVDRVFLDLRAELGKTARLIITGGDAERIRPLLSVQPSYEPDLVLKGLAVYAGTAQAAQEKVATVEAAACEH